MCSFVVCLEGQCILSELHWIHKTTSYTWKLCLPQHMKDSIIQPIKTFEIRCYMWTLCILCVQKPIKDINHHHHNQRMCPCLQVITTQSCFYFLLPSHSICTFLVVHMASCLLSQWIVLAFIFIHKATLAIHSLSSFITWLKL